MASKDAQQSPTVGGANKSSNPSTLPQQQWFISEIQQMMHGLGDCRRPLQESAILVEEITQHQMMSLLYKASDVASMRGAKLIGVEDILFLMRKDKVKLKRLLKYLGLKDLKSYVLRNAEDEDVDHSADSKSQPQKKRKRICYDFLASIDQTGELLDLFEEETEDEVKYERLLRAELRSRCLDPQQYMEFCEARQANFGKRYKSQRFKDWLLNGMNLEIKPSIHALEVISYLAYETVAQWPDHLTLSHLQTLVQQTTFENIETKIVDLSLLVKHDQNPLGSNPLTHTMPSINHNLNESATLAAMMGSNTQHKFQGMTSPAVSPPTTPSISGQSTPTTPGSTSGQQLLGSTSKSKCKKKRKSGPAHSLETPLDKAIMISDIQEAMRRYASFIGPFASEFKMNPFSSPRHSFLSC